MTVELVTFKEAYKLGLVHDRILNRSHGAFGESDNSYYQVVRVGDEETRVGEDDLIVYSGKSPNREVLQVISGYVCSDFLMGRMNPGTLDKRKEEKYRKFLELRADVMNDEYLRKKYN